MKVAGEPVHLPGCPINPEAYDRLYAFNQGLDNQMPDSATWQQIRIKPGSSEIDIYRLLPSAFDFEYSGYLSLSASKPATSERPKTSQGFGEF